MKYIHFSSNWYFYLILWMSVCLAVNNTHINDSDRFPCTLATLLALISVWQVFPCHFLRGFAFAINDDCTFSTMIRIVISYGITVIIQTIPCFWNSCIGICVTTVWYCYRYCSVFGTITCIWIEFRGVFLRHIMLKDGYARKIHLVKRWVEGYHGQNCLQSEDGERIGYIFMKRMFLDWQLSRYRFKFFCQLSSWNECTRTS